MKKGILLSMIICTAICLSAQSKKERQVTGATENLYKAMVDADSSVLDKITATKLSYGHSSGKVEDKTSFIENIMNGNSDFVQIGLDEKSVIINGKTAISRHILYAKTHDRGKEPTDIKIRIILVWQKQAGKWKLLARQAIKFG